jgi:hypothetical protein
MSENYARFRQYLLPVLDEICTSDLQDATR